MVTKVATLKRTRRLRLDKTLIMGVDEEIDTAIENVAYYVKAGWNYLAEWVGSYFKSIADTPSATRNIHTVDDNIFCRK